MSSFSNSMTIKVNTVFKTLMKLDTLQYKWKSMVGRGFFVLNVFAETLHKYSTINCTSQVNEELRNGSRMHRPNMGRTMLLDSDATDISCNGIRSRNYFPSRPGSKIEAEFPILFVRIVYRVG